MLDRALDAILRRVRNLDRDHDIPYLAGYSQDGKTIYIDRHMPRTMKSRGREIGSDRFLILHEEVEKTLIDQLGLHYCMHIRLRPARRKLPSVLPASSGAMQKHVKTIGDERLTKVPADLDLKPYRDEHDYDLIKRIHEAIEAGKTPNGIDGTRLKKALYRHARTERALE